MEVTLKELAGPVTCAALVGRLDAAGADRIGLQFTAGVAAKGRNAVIDMSGVEFVASMGIRLLVSAARALNQKGARMVLFGAQPMVHEVLVDAALDQILPIVATEADALAGLAAN